eukprot:6096479-Alexandrium_andersonii.AAC.1
MGTSLPQACGAHMWWECGRFARIRQDIWGDAAPSAEGLPPLLRDAGLVPKAIYRRGAAWWGDPAPQT